MIPSATAKSFDDISVSDSTRPTRGKDDKKQRLSRLFMQMLCFHGTYGHGLIPMITCNLIELVDDKHRYGKFIRVFFIAWQDSKSELGFNAWMKCFETGDLNSLKISKKVLDDIDKQGLLKDSRPANLPYVLYLTEEERKNLQLIVTEGGRISTVKEGVLNTPKDGIHIFVLGPDDKIYIGLYERGRFHHSSFFAGGVIKSGGELLIVNGVLKTVTDKSGHYSTSRKMIFLALTAFKRHGISLVDVELVLHAHEGSSLAKEITNADKYLEEKSFSREAKREMLKLSYD